MPYAVLNTGKRGHFRVFLLRNMRPMSSYDMSYKHALQQLRAILASETKF